MKYQQKIMQFHATTKYVTNMVEDNLVFIEIQETNAKHKLTSSHLYNRYIVAFFSKFLSGDKSTM